MRKALLIAVAGCIIGTLPHAAVAQSIICPNRAGDTCLMWIVGGQSTDGVNTAQIAVNTLGPNIDLSASDRCVGHADDVNNSTRYCCAFGGAGHLLNTASGGGSFTLQATHLSSIPGVQVYVDNGLNWSAIQSGNFSSNRPVGSNTVYTSLPAEISLTGSFGLLMDTAGLFDTATAVLNDAADLIVCADVAYTTPAGAYIIDLSLSATSAEFGGAT